MLQSCLHTLKKTHLPANQSAFYLSYFKGYKCDKLYELIPKNKVLMGTGENKFQISQELDNAVKIVTSKVSF